ncbi:winged helix-turn-helix domain-containing tetratricopeptide repeat protein [Bradyrhizobium erythrophlei]|uniref:winged helix-turn-helix domain-containing tetratricopeptide repeat protein n=1 Tax=Bradyrhizobium erythrophlei TaxID=1437360 RepID=UPI0035E7F17E
MRYFFEDYVLDTDRRELRRGAAPVPTTPQVFDLLDHLIRNRERVVGKDELASAIWKGRIVSDAALTTRLNAARSTIGDSGEEQRLIKTLPRRGFRFVGTVHEVNGPDHTGVVADGPAESSGTPAALPDRPLSILVLPFANLSGDPGQDYFVDGVTEDLTTELSRLAGSFVIAHNTAFSFKGKSVDVKRVARELGIRYVVEGNVRRAGQRVRVGVQLINAETGAHLWADRFDREASELLDLQDAIAIELARALDVQLIEAESRRGERSANPDAIALVMRARARLFHGMSRANVAAAIQHYKDALRLVPDDAWALAELADVLAGNVSSLWSETPREDLRQAEALAAQAIELEPSDAYCHHVVGVVLSLQGQFPEAIDRFGAAIRLNPNLHFAYSGLGNAKVLSGLGQEALQHFAHFIRLSPRDPFLFRGYYGIGLVQFQLGDDARAIETLGKAISLSPGYPLAHLCLAAAHGVQGRIDEAKASFARYLRTGASARTIFALQRLRSSANPSYLALRDRLYEGLRGAGMPER